jgi:hypothetical protein
VRARGQRDVGWESNVAGRDLDLGLLDARHDGA